MTERSIPATAEPLRPARGRPSLYRTEFAEVGYKLALLGLTDADMATFFEVDERTVNRWKIDHPQFCQSITRGKVIADAEVAASLYRRAIGYSHPAVKIFMPAGATEPVYAPYMEHVPPDTQAASLWLRNRRPGEWRDKTDVKVSGSLGLEHWVLESMQAEKRLMGDRSRGKSKTTEASSEAGDIDRRPKPLRGRVSD
jgi:hypothetical protein